MPFTKPTDHIDWTDGNPNFSLVTIDPGGAKRQQGWTPGERPKRETMNWIEWVLDEWDKYFELTTDDHEARIAVLEAAGFTVDDSNFQQIAGTTGQSVFDSIDDKLDDIANAITQGKGADLLGFVVGVTAHWDATIPDMVGDALDQLASRVRAIESAPSNVDPNIAIHDAVVGNPTDVTNAVATHSTLSGAITAAPTGGLILVLKSYAPPAAAPVTIAKKVTIRGQGHATDITQTGDSVTIASDYVELESVRFGGDLILNNDGAMVRGWQSTGQVVTDNGTGNSIDLVQE